MSVPSLRAPARGVAAVVLVAVVGGLALLGGWPDEPTDRTASAAASAATEPGGVDTPSESAAVTTATAVLSAWSRPGLTYPWWWNGLRPLLSPGARAAYAHTDPEQVPALGQVRPVAERRAPTTATVWFRTDAGRFGVDLARDAGDGEWRAHRILFPGQESMFG